MCKEETELSKRCLIIGSVMLDISVNLERVPEVGEDIQIYNQTMSLGGCAYNVSDIMKHFHAEYDLCAPIGKGYNADIIRKELDRTEKNALISVDYADNGYCMCLIDRSGERTFLTLPGVECQFKSEWFSKIEPEKYDSVYVCGYQLEGEAEAIVEYLEKHEEWLVYYAPGPRICNIQEKIQRRMFALHPILHVNEKEALSYTGCETYAEAAKMLNKLTDNVVIVTLGEQGAYVCEREEQTMISSVSQKAIDTTGAGDSHIGTIIAALSHGKTICEAVELANKVASFVIGVPGAVVSDEQFKNFMQTAFENKCRITDTKK